MNFVYFLVVINYFNPVEPNILKAHLSENVLDFLLLNYVPYILTILRPKLSWRNLEVGWIF